MSFRVLLVDDEPAIRLSVRRYLELLSYDVETARNGREALELMLTFVPQLLILDIKMPGMSGFIVAERVRKNERFRHLPIVFLTHLNSAGDRVRGYEAGCDVYLSKPFDLEELAAIVQTLAKRWHEASSYPNSEEFEAGVEREKLALTSREKEVLKHLIAGLSNAEIGKKVFLSARTVEKYVSHMLRKTNRKRRTELISYALKNNLIE